MVNAPARPCGTAPQHARTSKPRALGLRVDMDPGSLSDARRCGSIHSCEPSAKLRRMYCSVNFKDFKKRLSFSKMLMRGCQALKNPILEQREPWTSGNLNCCLL